MLSQRIPESLDDRLGLEVARRRKAKGVSQVALARALGWFQPTLCKVETGRKRATVAELLQICAALDVDPLTVLRAVIRDK